MGTSGGAWPTAIGTEGVSERGMPGGGGGPPIGGGGTAVKPEDVVGRRGLAEGEGGAAMTVWRFSYSDPAGSATVGPQCQQIFWACAAPPPQRASHDRPHRWNRSPRAPGN